MKERNNILKKNKNMCIERKTLNKNNILIILLLMTHSIYARLDTRDASTIQKMKLGDKDSQVVIDPEGGLSPFYQCIMERSGYIKNLRGYLHAIDGSGDQVGGYGSTIFKESSEYMQAFTQQLINMFPSEDRYLSIESENPDSFTRFLRRHEDRSDSLYILASLFLLSEGINIPIRIVESKVNKNKILILKKKKVKRPKEEEDRNISSEYDELEKRKPSRREGFHINLHMNIKKKNKEGKTVERTPQKKTEEIVSFFKSIATTNSSYCLKVPEEFSMPTTHEEFLKGNFLCNPKFLVQSYFFEYIDSVEMYEEFVRAVYELITEQILNNDKKKSENISMKTGKKAQEVFDSLFIKQDSAELPSKVKYTEDFILVEHKLNDELQPMPYFESAKLPIYDYGSSDSSDSHNVFLQEFMPSYNRKTDEFVNAELSKYTISIEPALLFLFFLFAFDSSTGRYDISHMPNPSKELKRFFAKYSDPLQVMDYTMYREWHRVVEDLPNKDISYRLNSSDSRNEIQFGILNMIYIMREIAAENDTKINENIESIKNIINDSDEISDSDKNKLLIDIQKICISLSKNKEIKIWCNDIFTKELKNSIKDIGMHSNSPLKIIYKKKEEDPGSIVIDIDDLNGAYDHYNGDVKCEVSGNMLRNKRSNVEKTLYDIKKIYMKSKNYIGCIMRQYANLYLDKISYAIKGEYRFIKRIKYILNSGHTNPNGLLLCGNLETLHYKYEITKIFLEKHRSYTKSYRNIIGKNNPMVQFTRNLIGSVPINEYILKEKFQSSGIYDGEYKNWYPWVEQDVSTDTPSNNNLQPSTSNAAS